MLFGWMKSLIFYLLLATIVTHMAPSNQYKQYIRYFIGLVVIVLLASPLKFLFEFGSGDLQELLQEIEHVEGQESVAGVAEASRIIMVWASGRDSKKNFKVIRLRMLRS